MVGQYGEVEIVVSLFYFFYDSLNLPTVPLNLFINLLPILCDHMKQTIHCGRIQERKTYFTCPYLFNQRFDIFDFFQPPVGNVIWNASFLELISEILDRLKPVRNKHIGFFNVVKVVYPVERHCVHFEIPGISIQLGH